MSQAHEAFPPEAPTAPRPNVPSRLMVALDRVDRLVADALDALRTGARDAAAVAEPLLVQAQNALAAGVRP